MKISVKRYNTRRTEAVPPSAPASPGPEVTPAAAAPQSVAATPAPQPQAAPATPPRPQAGGEAPSFAARPEARPTAARVQLTPAPQAANPRPANPAGLSISAQMRQAAAARAPQGSAAARPRPAADPGEMLFETPEDGFGDAPFPTSAAAQAQSANPELATGGESSAAADIDAIRREGLTGRQLRMARRMAQKYGLPATSDFDAVRLLRGAGIDPFQKGDMLDMIAAEDEAEEGAGKTRSTAMVPVPGDGVRLPQTVKPAKVPAPPPPAQAEMSHLAELSRIQQDLVRRRRRNGFLMALRLLFFVALPGLLAGIYYYRIATPLYATKTEFVIQQADPSTTGGTAAGGMLSSRSPLGAAQDSIVVQGYLMSRDAMLRLDRDVNFRALFTDPKIDPIQRLEANPTDEATYKVYQRNVRIAFDPTEGIIKMEVIAPNPEASVKMSRALIGYAEEQVDQLTQRLREDQMKGARENYEAAEAGVKEAQRRVVELQRRYKVLSSSAEVDLITSQISSLEGQLTKDRLGLAQMESNKQPNLARMEPLKRRIATMEAQIAEMRARLTEQDSDGRESLAEVQSEMLLAQADVETRQEILSKALESMEAARIAANQQVRYLSLAVSPIAPDEATYPRAFENTTVAILIFAGIYLMISMTAAILREQITA
jgi:capsular polysaccharide transport system permease protein